MTVNFEQFRSSLESEQKHLLRELEELEANIRPAEVRREGSPYGKKEEEATESFEFEKRIALEKRIRDSLVEVKHALGKLDEGTYGLCDDCGQSIDPARLEALPQASLCVNCKVKNAKGRSSPG